MKHEDLLDEAFGDWLGSKAKGVATRAASKVTGGGLKAKLKKQESIRQQVESMINDWNKWAAERQIDSDKPDAKLLGRFLRQEMGIDDRVVKATSKKNDKVSPGKPVGDKVMRQYFLDLITYAAKLSSHDKEKAGKKARDQKGQTEKSAGAPEAQAPKVDTSAELVAMVNQLPRDEKEKFTAAYLKAIGAK